jgi:hypothetical protein
VEDGEIDTGVDRVDAGGPGRGLLLGNGLRAHRGFPSLLKVFAIQTVDAETILAEKLVDTTIVLARVICDHLRHE